MITTKRLTELQGRIKRQQEFFKSYDHPRIKIEIDKQRIKNDNMVDNLIVSEMETELTRLKKSDDFTLPLLIHEFEKELEKIKGE